MGVFKLHVSEVIGPEYVTLVADVCRLVVLQVITQSLMSLSDPSCCFFSGSFFVILWYLVIGSMTYHLVFRQLVVIT